MSHPGLRGTPWSTGIFPGPVNFDVGVRFSLVLIASLASIADFSNAQDVPIRVGLIEPIEGSGLRQEWVRGLGERLVDVDASGGPGSLVELLRCAPEQISISEREIEGACGRRLRLPEAWRIADRRTFYRGAINGPWRPGGAGREKLRQTRPKELKGWFSISESQIPSDVIVMVDEDGNWELACDWDADLTLAEHETFSLAAAPRKGRPHLFSRGKAVVIIQRAGARRKDETRGDQPDERLGVRIWTLAGSSYDVRTENERLIPAFCRLAAANVDFELVWLSAGDLRYPSGRLIGPADFAAAMSAARRLKCDLVVVNLDLALSHPTDAAQLIARLSLETSVATVLNRRTTVSPNFVVHPERASIPDVAEFRYRNDSASRAAFESLLSELLSDPEARRQRFASHEKMDADDLQPGGTFADHLADLQFDQFRRVGDRHVAARIPPDAVDGRIAMAQIGEGWQVPFSDVATVKLYDAAGKRISGLDHGNGIRFDRAPPMEAVLGRRGYVVAEREVFHHGKTVSLNSKECRIRWSRGEQAIIDAPLHFWHQRAVRLLSRTELPDSLELAASLKLARLERVLERDVPELIRHSARDLLDRGPLVQSFWYREAPTRGSSEFRPVFQEVDGQMPPWDDSHLQSWRLLETGWMAAGNCAMGDLPRGASGSGWILVQAPNLKETAELGFPRLVQRVGGADLQGDRTWKRTYHQPQPAAAARKDSGFWLDEFRSAGWNPSPPMGDLLWTSLTAPATRGPAVCWLRLRTAVGKEPDRDWLWYYDRDQVDEKLAHLRHSGLTAEQALAATPRPAAESTDLFSWRRHLLALDDPAIRKRHLDRVVATAERVLKLCEQELGGLPPAEDPYRREFEATVGAGSGEASSEPLPAYRGPNDPIGNQRYAWAADAAYRRVRAIGYRELPEVVAVQPIEDRAQQDREFDRAFRQLCGLAVIKDPRFVLALVRYERRRGRLDQAYEMLCRHGYEGPAVPWFFKKERDLWDEAGWEPLRRLGHARWFQKQAGMPVRH